MSFLYIPLTNCVQTWFIQEETLQKRQNNGQNLVIVRNKNCHGFAATLGA